MSEHELYHYGILGMKWGIRRYQNEDGSLTEAGKKRYDKVSRRFDRELNYSTRNDKRILESISKNNKRQHDAITKREKKLGLDENGDYSITDAKLHKLYSKLLRNAAEERQYRIGSEIFNNNIAKYKEMKLKELSDSSVKDSSEYKNVEKQYKDQTFVARQASGEINLKLMYGKWFLESLSKNK